MCDKALNLVRYQSPGLSVKGPILPVFPAAALSVNKTKGRTAFFFFRSFSLQTGAKSLVDNFYYTCPLREHS